MGEFGAFLVLSSELKRAGGRAASPIARAPLRSKVRLMSLPELRLRTSHSRNRFARTPELILSRSIGPVTVISLTNSPTRLPEEPDFYVDYVPALTAGHSSREHFPITLRRFTELLLCSILFSSNLAPGFPGGAALRSGATLDNNQNHQTENSSRGFG